MSSQSVAGSAALNLAMAAWICRAFAKPSSIQATSLLKCGTPFHKFSLIPPTHSTPSVYTRRRPHSSICHSPVKYHSCALLSPSGQATTRQYRKALSDSSSKFRTLFFSRKPQKLGHFKSLHGMVAFLGKLSDSIPHGPIKGNSFSPIDAAHQVRSCFHVMAF